MIKKIIIWWKKLFRIVRDYDEIQQRTDLQLKAAVDLIRDSTEIHVDAAYTRKGVNNIVVIGRYKRTDFIQTYSISTDDFCALVNHLKEMEKFGRVGKVDAPPVIRATVLRDLDFY